jgi:hypothetical protein
MVWAKLLLAAGLVMLFAGFGFGTEQRPTTQVNGVIHSCDAAIPASWLVSGTPDGTTTQSRAATSEERRAVAACSAVTHRSRVLLVTTMGVGGLLAVIGWTALSEHRRSTTVTYAVAR